MRCLGNTRATLNKNNINFLWRENCCRLACSHSRGKNCSASFCPERALDLGNAGGNRASPSPTRPPDPCAIPVFSIGKTRSAPPFFLERAECASSAPQISFFSITLFYFILFYIIFIHNMRVRTLAHRRPPFPPPRKKTGRASSPFSEGKNRRAGFRSQRVGVGSEGKGRR